MGQGRHTHLICSLLLLQQLLCPRRRLVITSVIDALVFTQRQPERTRTAVIGVDDEAEAAFGTAAVRRAHLGCLPHGRASAGALQGQHVGLGLRAARAAATAPPAIHHKE